MGKHVLHPYEITVQPHIPGGPPWSRPRVTHLQPHLSRQGARLHMADEDARFLDGAAGNAVGEMGGVGEPLLQSACSFNVLPHLLVCPGPLCPQYPSPLPSTSSTSVYQSWGNNYRKLLLTPHTQPLIQHADAVSSFFLAFSNAFFKTQMLSSPHGFNQTPYSLSRVSLLLPSQCS